MIYSSINYLGYATDFHPKEIPNKANGSGFAITIPDIHRNSCWTRSFRSLDLVKQDVSVLDLLQNVFFKRVQRVNLNALLSVQKKTEKIVKILEVKDPWYDFFVVPEFSIKNKFERALRPIELNSTNIQIKNQYKVSIPNTQACIPILHIPEYFELERKILPSPHKTLEKPFLRPIQIQSDFNPNTNRKVFIVNIENNSVTIPILDIRLKRKPQSLKLPNQKLLNPPVSLPENLKNPKFTLIESLSDLKKLKPLEIKKSVSFSNNYLRNSYYAQDHLTQIPKLPLKVFIKKSNSICKSIITSIPIENYYIVGLELDEKYMDSMDIILTWVTGIKICNKDTLYSEEKTYMFLISLRDQIIKFDLVLLVFIDNQEVLKPGLEVIDRCVKFLEASGIKLRYMILKDFNHVSEILFEYLEKYLKDIGNKETWVYLQERLDESTPFINEQLNVYAHSIFNNIKYFPSQKFAEICHTLGASNRIYDILCNLPK